MNLVTIQNQNIEHVQWDDQGTCDFKVDDHVDIWKVNVTANMLRLGHIPNVLSANELIRANKYMRDADRIRFFISRSALRVILGQYLQQGPALIEFQLGENHKPFIAGHFVQFNLSDSADWVLIAVARSEVGVDVEYIKPGFNYDGIIKSNFNTPEIEYINADNHLERFFQLWTRKEAILKATGTGLTEHLQAITALDGSMAMEGDLLDTVLNWKLSTFELAKDYPATVATSIAVEKYKFYNFRF